MSDLVDDFQIAYRAFENRAEIEDIAQRLKLYLEMARADSDLWQRIARLVKVMFPQEAAPAAQSYDVKWIQETLNKRFPGNLLTVDGDYGPATKAAVMIFQATMGLEADGWVGPKTFAALVNFANRAG